MASLPESWDGTQKIVTVEVMRSFYCGSSADPRFEALEENEQLSVPHSRRRQISETPSPPLSPVPPDDMVFCDFKDLMIKMLSTPTDQLPPEEQERARMVGDRLRRLGDTMDDALAEEHRDLLNGLLHPTKEIQETIRESLRKIKKITAMTVVKVFKLGLLLLSAPPSSEYEYRLEERQLIKNIFDSVVEEITTWVMENGGWDQVLNSTDEPSSPLRPHSSSTPTLPQVSPPTGSSSDFERNWRSHSFSASRPVPNRTRHLSEPNSVPSSPTTRGRSMSSSLMTIGAAAFGLALMHYLQS
ncbi:PREDICTED: uncharacterized protein LOC109588922 [Amphimedon queenslandica]|uniref:Uncharacterized protein n=1 Tax=Amphimedon queenslandica TaxID=400682 RepID=A0A1X7VNS9_AMPQE|nr:PREDICTED: uncharacterized protein LOC109588922 [Amphimedon queenslandica]|eukprot:XP_019860585.1 PREDICTED: uncharacterized protein LOC109588922 [Amphimedon queenslandica]